METKELWKKIYDCENFRKRKISTKYWHDNDVDNDDDDDDDDNVAMSTQIILS